MYIEPESLRSTIPSRTIFNDNYGSPRVAAKLPPFHLSSDPLSSSNPTGKVHIGCSHACIPRTQHRSSGHFPPPLVFASGILFVCKTFILAHIVPITLKVTVRVYRYYFSQTEAHIVAGSLYWYGEVLDNKERK